MVEMTNNQPGQFMTIRPLDPRNEALNFTSYSCRPGAQEAEHLRCSTSPDRPIAGLGIPADDIAPRCVCECHRTVVLGQITELEIRRG